MFRTSRLVLCVFSATVLLTVSGCGGDAKDVAAEPASGAEKPLNDQAAPARKNNQAKRVAMKPKKPVTTADPSEEDSQEPREPDPLMDAPLDLSTPEKAQQSISEFNQTASEKQVASLSAAISYLQFHDLSARGNVNLLYRRLHGKTPNEIIAMTSK